MPAGTPHSYADRAGRAGGPLERNAVPALVPSSALRRPVPSWAVGVTIAALLAATALLPGWVAARWPGSGPTTLSTLGDRVRSAFLGPSPAVDGTAAEPLDQVVAFWQGFHLVKALTAAALLAVLVVAGTIIERRHRDADRRRQRWTLAALGLLVAGAATLALLVVVANVQGAVAPLASVLTLLPVGGADPAVRSMGAEFAAELRGGAPGPAAGMLLADFRLYHLALVGCLLLVVTGLLVGLAMVVRTVRARRRTVPGAQSRTGALTVTAVLLGGLLAFFLLVGVANLATAADPAPALAAFFEGAAG